MRTRTKAFRSGRRAKHRAHKARNRDRAWRRRHGLNDSVYGPLTLLELALAHERPWCETHRPSMFGLIADILAAENPILADLVFVEAADHDEPYRFDPKWMPKY